MKKSTKPSHFLSEGQTRIAQILREFEMGCDEAIIRREGKRLILEPVKNRGLSNLKRSKPSNNAFFDPDLMLLPPGDIRL